MGMSLIANSESPTTARHNGEHSDGEWRIIDVTEREVVCARHVIELVAKPAIRLESHELQRELRQDEAANPDYGTACPLRVPVHAATICFLGSAPKGQEYVGTTLGSSRAGRVGASP
jgi:hypothetical protein